MSAMAEQSGQVVGAEWRTAEIVDDTTGEAVMLVSVRPTIGGVLSSFGEPLSVDFHLQQPDDVEPMVEGHVKWDGCVNWQTPENYMAHACEPREFEYLALGFQTARRMAAGLMPHGAELSHWADDKPNQ